MQNNVCSDILYCDMGTCFYMFEQKKMKHFKILYTKYVEYCEAMRLSTHSFAYSYQLFKKCVVEITKIQISYLPYFFNPIYIKFALFYSKCFTLSIELT